ncbi:hypothetical protein FJZ18_02730 [Candidatus Pacearchaeota archaeon]|nr:hypothetical protein [Candidatus Pacearchaeota archaeon]
MIKGEKKDVKWGKRGALEASETGEWTLFIIAAVILLAFVGILYALLKGSSEDDICKLSVLGRATTPISETQQAIPLKCVAKKVCFNDGRGKCEESLLGEKGVKEIKLPKVDVENEEALEKAAELIEEESARKMYECWKTMGEGKLDLFNGVKVSFGIDPVRTTCVICSRLVIDKNVPLEVLERVDVNDYMKTHPVTSGSSITYLQAFTGSKDVKGYAKFNEEVFKVDDNGSFDNSKLVEQNENIAKGLKDKRDREIAETAKLDVGPSSGRENRELAFVFMQIKPKSYSEVLGNMAKTGGLVVGSTFMTPVVKPVRMLTTKILWNPVGIIATGVAGVGIAGYGAYNVKQGQLTAAGYCGEFTTKEKEEEKRKGCSMVQGLNYNKEEINALCASIQGRLYE